MEYLLSWQNLLFLIPIAAGLLLAIGTAMGFGGEAEHDVDTDVDADADADADGDGDSDGDSAGDKALSLFGIGKVPLGVILMTAFLIFGCVGIASNAFLAPLLRAPVLYGLVSLGVAFVTMVLLTGKVARLIGRLMPTTETYTVSKDDLVGVSGTLVLPATATSGLAQVYDHDKNMHQIICISSEGELPQGSEILVIDYNSDKGVYTVVKNPAADAGQPSPA